MVRLVSIGECMVELAPHGALWQMGIAGDTLNTAWYARALLPKDDEVAYLTALGHDAFSDRALAMMTEAGIATDLIQRHPSRSIGLYAIALKDGERSFAYWRDTSAARTLADGPEALEGLKRADVIHVSGVTLAILPPEGRARLIAALGAARRRGALTVLDPNYRPRLWPDAASAAATLMAAAQVASLLLPSFDDEAALFGDASPTTTAARYRAAGASTVVVKTGGGPILIDEAGAAQILTDLPKVTPLDTTGAGDSFNAGFLAARIAGADAADAARAGHALAARVVRHPGALMPMDLMRC